MICVQKYFKNKRYFLYCTVIVLVSPAFFMILLLNMSTTQRIYNANNVNSIFKSCDLEYDKNGQLPTRKPKNFTDFTSDVEVAKITRSGCWNIIQHYSFDVDVKHYKQEEKEYPIAYSIVAHQNAQQIMFLLSQIYAPHNAYCVHLDAKSPLALFEALKNLQNCFPNVRLTPNREFVVYASFSRLQADINCMEDLLRTSVPWKHLINLSGQVSRQLLLLIS